MAEQISTSVANAATTLSTCPAAADRAVADDTGHVAGKVRLIAPHVYGLDTDHVQRHPADGTPPREAA